VVGVLVVRESGCLGLRAARVGSRPVSQSSRPCGTRRSYAPACIAIRTERRAERGDRYDINYVTTGLSRYDIVTADASMAQLARDNEPVLTDGRLFSSREMQAFDQAVVVQALADRPDGA
jgi:hypothetical protein